MMALCYVQVEKSPKDVFKFRAIKNNFTEGHKFCQECVFRAAEVAFGEGKVILKCLADCTGESAKNWLKSYLKIYQKNGQQRF